MYQNHVMKPCFPTYLGISSGMMPHTPTYDPLKQQIGGYAASYYEKLQEKKRRMEEKKLK